MAIAAEVTLATATPPSAAWPAAGGRSGSQPGTCVQCGAEIASGRRTARQNQELCTACDQRERRAAYFRTYYVEHKDRILDKNRRWARDNKTRILQLRRSSRAKTLDADAAKTCLNCDTPVTRAARCRKCYIRIRYATDAAYRAQRLATTRRWLDKRQVDPAEPRRISTRTTTRATVPTHPS